MTKLVLFCPLTAANLNNVASLAITKVKLWVGRTVIYDSSKQFARAELKASGLYRSSNHDGNEMECFPVILDIAGTPAEYLNLVEGNVRQTVKLEYTWAAGTTPETVHILAEGIIQDNSAPLVAAI